MASLAELFGLDGRIAVVTGGAQGIGAAICETLAALRAKVVVADLNIAGAQELAQKICGAGGQAAAVAIDIGDERSVISGVANIVSNHGAPWVLVNNAGIQNRKPFFEIDPEYFDMYHRINTRGTFLMLQEIAKHMIDAKSGGRIVNIASLAVKHPTLFGLTAYTASKGGVMGLTTASALELLEHNITVNAVLPGGTMTPGGLGATGTIPAGPATRGFPLGICEPIDIAGAVAYLVSPVAGRVTGQALGVDSGFLLT